MKLTELIEASTKQNKNIQIIPIKKEDIVFEENVRMNCFYCEKYGKNWRCPPKLPTVDFTKLFSEFKNVALVVNKCDINSKEDYVRIRNESALQLHLHLLFLEHVLWQGGCSNCLSFIGGSCRLCKDGCNKEHCAQPGKSRSPIEATGVNVIKTCAKYGIEITFPTITNITRVGLILW